MPLHQGQNKNKMGAKPSKATVTFAGVIAFLDTFEQRNYNWIYYVFLMCYTWSQGSVTFFLFFNTVIVLALGSFVPYIKANMVE
jgi:hypothetical protein